jgi:sulfoxide reductase heme-binding subunit YedZ
LAYVIPALGVLHFWWLVKADVREPLVYALLYLALMLLRWKPLPLWFGSRGQFSKQFSKQISSSSP